jgi:phosphatidylglycerophosphate synthase
MAPVSGLTVLVVVVGWQVAFALDCTDGQLARARGVSSAFGAWLDQLADFLAHLAVYVALGIFLVRALHLSPIQSALLVPGLFAGSVFLLFAVAERNALLGTGEGIQSETKAWVRGLAQVRQFADYGAILFIASLLLLFPEALLIFLGFTAAMSATTVFGQVGYNWIRLRAPEPRSG